MKWFIWLGKEKLTNRSSDGLKVWSDRCFTWPSDWLTDWLTNTDLNDGLADSVIEWLTNIELNDGLTDSVTDWPTLIWTMIWLTQWPTDWLTDQHWSEWWSGWLRDRMTDQHWSDWWSAWLSDWLTDWLPDWLCEWLTISQWDYVDDLQFWPIDWLTGPRNGTNTDHDFMISGILHEWMLRQGKNWSRSYVDQSTWNWLGDWWYGRITNYPTVHVPAVSSRKDGHLRC